MTFVEARTVTSEAGEVVEISRDKQGAAWITFWKGNIMTRTIVLCPDHANAVGAALQAMFPMDGPIP